MKRRLLPLLLTALLALSLAGQSVWAAPAQTGSADHFAAVLDYDGRFADVTADSWYYDNVVRLYEMGLARGRSDTLFGAADSVTVAEAVGFAARIHSLYWTGDAESGPAAYGGDGGRWYDPYVRWGMESGVLPGALWDGFDPEASVTRQDMAVMFGLFLTEYEVDYDPVNTETASFTDSADIDSYALGGVALCWQAGIMGGRTDGSFGPQDTATRAEVAVTMVQMARVMDR